MNIPHYHGADQIVRLPQPSLPRTEDTPRSSDESERLSLILSTASSLNEAKLIARHLLDNKLVACVNILPSITSLYTWEGKIEESTEVQLFLKVTDLRRCHLLTLTNLCCRQENLLLLR
jgi:uncharacterized protein involved in tolerance to divalent cations